MRKLYLLLQCGVNLDDSEEDIVFTVSGRRHQTSSHSSSQLNNGSRAQGLCLLSVSLFSWFVRLSLWSYRMGKRWTQQKEDGSPRHWPTVVCPHANSWNSITNYSWSSRELGNVVWLCVQSQTWTLCPATSKILWRCFNSPPRISGSLLGGRSL